MTGEQLVIVVIVGIVLLVNSIARVFRRWIRGKAPQAVEPVAPPASPPRRRPPLHVVQPLRGGQGTQDLSFPSVVRPTAVRRRASAILGSRRQVRRGIILMTILGPCRALEPPDTRA